MGCDPGATADETISHEQRTREAAEHDPDGSEYFAHLHQVIEQRKVDGVPSWARTIVRTNQVVYWNEPVAAFWLYDDKPRLPQAAHPKSELLFDVPDRVVADIQGRYAAALLGRFFGHNGKPMSQHGPIQSRSTDLERREQWLTQGDTHRVIESGDWQTLMTAIEATAHDSVGSLGGQRVTFWPRRFYTAKARLRVSGARLHLELLIDERLRQDIEQQWASGLLDVLSGTASLPAW